MIISQLELGPPVVRGALLNKFDKFSQLLENTRGLSRGQPVDCFRFQGFHNDTERQMEQKMVNEQSEPSLN